MSLSSIKNAIRSNHFLSSTASFIYRLFGFNTIRSGGEIIMLLTLKLVDYFYLDRRLKSGGIITLFDLAQESHI